MSDVLIQKPLNTKKIDFSWTDRVSYWPPFQILNPEIPKWPILKNPKNQPSKFAPMTNQRISKKMIKQ